ncbi:MAG: CPBP family glutamic-type intramembrane protease [Myxococcota bacterium]|nr:CPBP family glutamic-type intramembrane protease [Myxococcota bacterium]
MLAVVAAVLAMVWRAWEFVPDGALRTLLRIGPPLLAGAVALGSIAVARDRRAALGLAPGAWRRGAGSLALASALGVAALLAAGLALGTASLGAARLGWLLDYVPGLIAQQVLLQAFLNNRVFELCTPLGEPRRLRATVAATSAVFVVLHAPNPALMLGVAVAGSFWIWHFRRHGNLPALIASHLLLGVTAMACLGPGPMLDLRVGPPALDALRAR